MKQEIIDIASTLCEQTRLMGGWHWYKNFLILTSDIFISNVINIVINQKYFRTSLSSY